jgi:hypothetical protein
MQKRLIQALIYIAVAIGLAVGAASAAGAIGLTGGDAASDGMTWGWGGAAPAVTAEFASA